uniref:ribosomal protein L20 n=1 Tax=Prototheca tumulicola TaxID=1737639 RepID=UPI0030038836
MVRTSQNIISHKHKKFVLNWTKGFRGIQGARFRTLNEKTIKSLSNAYRDRRNKKRIFKKLWITRINAKLHNSLNWSTFHNFLFKKNIFLNKKICSFLALQDPDCFSKIFLKFL